MDSRDPSVPPPLTIEERITVDELEGRLLPAVSAPRGWTVSGSPTTSRPGRCCTPTRSRPGVTYTVTSVNPSVDLNLLPAADVPSGDAVARYLAVGDQPCRRT